MIVIIDYGMGNIYSIKNAFNYLGLEVILSNNPDTILSSDRIILPGVGSFYHAMNVLREKSLDIIIKESVLKYKKSILGICLGMQLLGKSSTEDSFCEGLGLIDCSVERFDQSKYPDLKVPHVGFNTVHIKDGASLYYGFEQDVDFYFTHSYRVFCENDEYVSGLCVHGETFVASFQKGHICGTQFHPEKSQSNGLQLLKNFVEKV